MELNDPALTFAVALAAGIVSQAVARHLRIPGIVLLLLVGALLGPDVANLVRPETLGGGLDIMVRLSVAVILFEGGLNLSVARLRREARVIRLLITVGALVTGVGGTLIARWAMAWPWPIAITFGALVIVTGPTVITPLLRRIRVRRRVATILEAEGVFIDPIGAILAVVALELALTETATGTALGLLALPSGLLLGVGVGLVGGFVIALLLRSRRLVPEGLETVVTLSLVLLLFQVSDSLQHESGIMAAVVAGLVVGNTSTRVSRELREFKEQLTVLLIGLLFVLLAASVRLEEVTALGWPGVAVVACLMFVARPLGVAASTWGSELGWRERTFIGWMGPRGIVAAAVASVFAERLLGAGYELGVEFRALVFLVIAVTVVVQGFTSGPVASLLGIRRPTDQGHVIVGANALGRALGGALKDAGEDVILIDTNDWALRQAAAAGLQVINGNAHSEQILLDADVEGRRSFSAVTTNESANLLLAREAKERYKVPDALAALDRTNTEDAPGRTEESRIELLFGRPLDLVSWIDAFRHEKGDVRLWRFRAVAGPPVSVTRGESPPQDPSQDSETVLPLVLIRDGAGRPVGDGLRFRPGDVVAFAMTPDADRPPPPTRGEWVPAQESPEPS